MILLSRMLCVILVFVGMLSSNLANAAIDVTINKSANDASPIAIVPFVNDSSLALDFDIAELIGSDLQKTGQFRLIARSALAAKPKLGETVESFQGFNQLGTNHLLLGRIHHAGSSEVVIDIELYDTNLGSKILIQSFSANQANIRRTAHYVADQVYEKITGIRGAFNTQIAYISVVRYSVDRSEYKLVIADSDGYNPKVVVTSSEPLLSPAWAPSGRELAYVSMRNQHAEIYSLNLDTGKEKRLAGFNGINGAPAYSPDGSELVATLSKSGTPNLYIYNFANQNWRQLTAGRSIDTEPAWSADGKYIYFTSSRSGSAQIYKIGKAGGSAKRVSFNGRYNAAVSAASDGNHIAMVHRDGSGYNIGVFDENNEIFTVVGRGRQDESPSFAPNGRMILYAGQDRGRQVLLVTSVDGRFSQTLLSLGEDIREPAWSPFVKISTK